MKQHANVKHLIIQCHSVTITSPSGVVDCLVMDRQQGYHLMCYPPSYLWPSVLFKPIISNLVTRVEERPWERGCRFSTVE